MEIVRVLVYQVSLLEPIPYKELAQKIINTVLENLNKDKKNKKIMENYLSKTGLRQNQNRPKTKPEKIDLAHICSVQAQKI